MKLPPKPLSKQQQRYNPMKKIILALIAVALAACSATQVNTALQTPTGQLFCAVQTAGGGAVVVGLINAEATAAGVAVPGVAPAVPLAVLATGAAKATVDADCAAAGGVAVSPPANPTAAPQVAIVSPKAAPAVAAPATVSK
jgi:hypothetical protein